MSHQQDNIFAGTRVVSLVEVRGMVEVRGTNNSLVHPRGAVGVVTRTPTGDQDQFLVRFPDGFEASLTREKLAVLKHFKDRLPQPDYMGREFNLEELVIYRCVVGSRAYAVKRGEAPWTDVDAWRKELHQDIERALAETILPERPDYEAANRFLIKARRSQV